jgi:hypothetical protein
MPGSAAAASMACTASQRPRRAAGGQAEQRDARAEGIIDGLFTELELRHIDIQHAFPGQDGLAASEGSHTADHHEKEEEADDLHHDERANHGQHHFDKLFHIEGWFIRIQK